VIDVIAGSASTQHGLQSERLLQSQIAKLIDGTQRARLLSLISTETAGHTRRIEAWDRRGKDQSVVLRTPRPSRISMMLGRNPIFRASTDRGNRDPTNLA
jgi:hypothetical protein